MKQSRIDRGVLTAEDLSLVADLERYVLERLRARGGRTVFRIRTDARALRLWSETIERLRAAGWGADRAADVIVFWKRGHEAA